ncbi:MAG: translesion error-prone DNA polymerase V autoproteolytic subunit [Cyanobium sp.]
MACDLPTYLPNDLIWLGPLRQEQEPLYLPLAVEAVSAGFPSPADDYVEAAIDLNGVLMPCPSSTFLMRVDGEAMRGEGIHHGDLLVVDRSVGPRPGSTVVAVHEGRFVLRRLEGRPSRWLLVASDAATPPIVLSGEDPDLLIWGVVIHAVHHLCTPGPRSRVCYTPTDGSPETLGIQPQA